ncbi:LCP family protein [Streptomyces sp. NPDC088729]|uniref:LCP family protein n=1 Tax=Streptomyces sp. NPDC088729 TaxID=3365876 RepID=UPI00380EA26A
MSDQEKSTGTEPRAALARDGVRGTGRHRRRTGRRGGAVLLTVVLGLGVLGASGAAYLLRRLDDSLTTVDVDRALGDRRPSAEPRGAMNILVLGSDSRAGADGRFGRDEGGSRSDTAMVVHLDAAGHRADVVSIPRDTLMRRPRGAPCRQHDSGGRIMFNEALSSGGPACAVAAAEQLSGLRMDHFVEIGFQGFVEVIDALGGVDVTTTEAIHDRYSHLDLPAGSHRLDGRTALALVRTRHGVGDGSDLGRIALQQAFVKALAARFRAIDVLRQPAKLYRLAGIGARSITTDSSLGSARALAGLAHRMEGVDSRNITAVTLPVGADTRDPNRVVPQEEPCRSLWKALRADRRVPDRVREASGERGTADVVR